MNTQYDYLIIGAGILGLSVAMQLLERFPDKKILVLEKEEGIAQHQTGHNSGVIHSGIYYTPGSLKAKLCKEGRESLIKFCNEHGVPYEQCGKLVAAVKEKELPHLENLYQRSLQNGISVEKLSTEQAKEIEPNLTALAAIHVPVTGIVNYKQVAEKYAEIFKAKGGEILFKHAVQKIINENNATTVETEQKSFQVKFLINCAGLQSDRIARLAGLDPKIIIIPFRGEYKEIIPEKRSLIKNLIYPVPEPGLPFLGVHFTRTIDGRMLVGPNALLNYSREGYRKTVFNLHDNVGLLFYKGFWKLGLHYYKTAFSELYMSLSKSKFTQEVNRYIPALKRDDFKLALAGIRAQALDEQGKLVDDFVMFQNENSMHVCNAPSPAATSSLAIGKYIIDKLK